MSTTSIDSNRIIRQTRIYRAPRQLVLQMWRKPELITKWWGPFGFTTTTHEMDFRPGGVWRYTMHGPDGTDYPNIIHYFETGPDRLEYDHGAEGDEVEFHVVVTLRELEPNKTEMVFTSVFPTAEERARVAREHGAEEGLNGTMTRLDLLLLESQSGQDPFGFHLALPSDTEILMTRSFRAPRVALFDAFTKPELMRRWWAPHGYEMPVCDVDLRVGGKWNMVHVDPQGGRHVFYGEYRQIEKPDRLVATFGFEPHAREFMLQDFTFQEQDGVTHLRVLATCKSKEDRDGMIESGMEWGSIQCYERLDALLKPA